VELNWSTFLLEIVNFLVLVWILKRFLYKPVLDVIARRRASIDKTLSEAKDAETNARDLQQRYDSRLAAWESEQRQAREALMVEIQKERATRLANLGAELEVERQKAQVAETQRLAVLSEQHERDALLLGARFATRLLKQAASPELEGKLIELALTELATLPDVRAQEILGRTEKPIETISVTSAFALPERQRAKIEAALRRMTATDVAVNFTVDPALLAGLRITAGASVLELNLAQELEDFARLSNGHG